jgi:RasGEF N-terminal motif
MFSVSVSIHVSVSCLYLDLDLGLNPCFYGCVVVCASDSLVVLPLMVFFLYLCTSPYPQGDIQAATLNKLIEHLTSPTGHDLEFRSAFFMTYRSFTTPSILLSKLIDR